MNGQILLGPSITLTSGSGTSIYLVRPCVAQAAIGGVPRCPISTAWIGENAGAHADAGDLVFDTQAVDTDGDGDSDEATPMVYSNDGGVYRNLNVGACRRSMGATQCHPARSLAVSAWRVSSQPGVAAEDIYYGTQDDGSFAQNQFCRARTRSQYDMAQPELLRRIRSSG